MADVRHTSLRFGGNAQFWRRRYDDVRAERDELRQALERIASHPLVAKSSDPAVQVDQMRLYASGALAPASDGEGA